MNEQAIFEMARSTKAYIEDLQTWHDSLLAGPLKDKVSDLKDKTVDCFDLYIEIAIMVLQAL